MTTEQAVIYRRMRPFERLRVAFGLHDFARRRLTAAMRRAHPHLAERELQEALLRRMLRHSEAKGLVDFAQQLLDETDNPFPESPDYFERLWPEAPRILDGRG